MLHRAMLRCWAVLLLGLLAACASQPLPASPAPTAAEPTRVPAAPTGVLSAPTDASAATQPPAAPTTAAPTTAAMSDSLTAEGYHVLGQPGAPVTLVMYSDFL